MSTSVPHVLFAAWEAATTAGPFRIVSATHMLAYWLSNLCLLFASAIVEIAKEFFVSPVGVVFSSELIITR